MDSAKSIHQLCRLLSIATLLIFLLVPTLLSAAEKELTLEDLSKTEAAQLYISKQYVQALEAFMTLEKGNPNNVIIKRYIAKLYDILRRRYRAISKLQEIISIKKDDFIARQMLGDLYMKEGEFLKALETYSYIAREDGSGEFRPYAQKRIEEMRALESLSGQGQTDKISLEQFIQSAGAKAFVRGDFEEA